MGVEFNVAKPGQRAAIATNLDSMIRSLIEKLCRGRAIRRRLPRGFGSRPIYLSPDSALQYLKPNWAAQSKDLLSAVDRFVTPGMNVWDIGANCGVFALSAAHRVGDRARVLAVEPDPFLASLIQRSAECSVNRSLSLDVLCAAVSDRTGVASLCVAARGRSSNALEQVGHRSEAGGTRKHVQVATVTLDTLLAIGFPPGFVKVDVEGAEGLVLAGAARLLNECRPAIYIEVGRQQSSQVASVFAQFRYRLFDGDSSDEREVTHCCWNTLAVPSESSLTNRGVLARSSHESIT